MILDNSEFRINIVLHIVSVTVEMIGRNIQQHGNIGFETIHVVELETTQFDHIIIIMFGRYLQGEALSHIPGQTYVEAGFFQYMIRKKRRGSLPVAAGNANHSSIGIATGKFYFRNNRCSSFFQRLYHRCALGYTGTLHHFIGIKNLLGRMTAFFPFDPVIIELLFIDIFYSRHIRDKDIETFDFRQNSCAGSTLTGSQYDNTFAHIYLLIEFSTLPMSIRPK